MHLLSIFSAGSIFFGQNSVALENLGDRVRDRVRVTHIQKRQFAGVQRLRCFSCTTSIAGATQSVTHTASAMLVMGLCRVSDGVPRPVNAQVRKDTVSVETKVNNKRRERENNTR
jgi:hypothetical protein